MKNQTSIYQPLQLLGLLLRPTHFGEIYIFGEYYANGNLWGSSMKFRALIPLITFSLSACTPMVLTKPGADDTQSAQLETAVDQIIRENQEVCKREEYKPLYLKSACKFTDISLEQLADTSRITATEKLLFPKLRSENQAHIEKAASAYRSYGGAQGLDGALVLERIERLSEKNALDLYEGTISWGDYSKRRKEIQQFYLDEFYKTIRPK